MPTFWECDRCTACCRWPGDVRLSDAEITRIATHLGISESEFIEQFTRLNQTRSGLSLTERSDGACILLDGHDCRIQPVKPDQCRGFPNRWSFPGFEQLCHAKPREVSQEEWDRRA